MGDYSTMGLDGDPELDDTEASMIGWIWAEISSSYVNICLTFAIVYLLYKILHLSPKLHPSSLSSSKLFEAMRSRFISCSFPSSPRASWAPRRRRYSTSPVPKTAASMPPNLAKTDSCKLGSMMP